MCFRFSFFGGLRFLPPWRLAFGAGKNLPVPCPFPVKNVTVAISYFYQFSITIALRFSARKDIFPHGGKRKNVVTGKPCGDRDKGIGEKKEQPEPSRLPV